jgi:hypothetical protein
MLEFKRTGKKILEIADLVGNIEIEGSSALLSMSYQDNAVPLIIKLGGDYNLSNVSGRRELLRSMAVEIKNLEEGHGTVSISGLSRLGYSRDIYHTNDPFSKQFIAAVEKEGPLIYSVI